MTPPTKIMKKYLLITLMAFVAISTKSFAEQSDGFQGLAWGSSILTISKKFPQAKQNLLRNEEEYPICKNSDGTARACTVSQQMCESLGMLCHPSLKMKNYMVGSYPFEVDFELSKDQTLSGVSLTYSGELTGERKEKGRQIFAHLMESLTQKYGQPVNVDEYAENRAGFMGGGYKWQTSASRINLNYMGQFGSDHKMVRTTITVIYSPLIDDFSSKL